MIELLVIATLALWGLKSALMFRQLRRLHNHPRQVRLQKKLGKDTALTFVALMVSMAAYDYVLPDVPMWAIALGVTLTVWGKIVLWPFINLRNRDGWIAYGSDWNIPVYLDMKDEMANARAYGGFGHSFVLCTIGLKKTLSDAELKAVLAHEYGHIKHHHHLRLVGIVSLLYSFAIFALSPESLGALLIVLWLAKGMMEPFIGFMMRHFEYEADQTAAKLSGRRIFTQSLEKIWQFNKNEIADDPCFAIWFNAHPKPEERLIRLQEGG